ncbi:MAG: helix-turn-helix domain-containing protein [Chloroflexota bacterium]|nr:helix-turn-helix domain-containing protein [Chloroflexota bacterium]
MAPTLRDNPLLRASEVAHILHVHKSTIRRWAKQGLIPYTSSPTGVLLFPIPTFRAWLRKTYGPEAALLLDEERKSESSRGA